MATLRQRFLGWARPRTPEALPAAIIRQRVYVLPTPFGGFIGALLATMLLGALNYNNNPALMLGFLLAAAVHNSFVRAHLNLSGLQLLAVRSEEHTSELQSLMRISFAAFCLKKKHLKSKANCQTTLQPT